MTDNLKLTLVNNQSVKVGTFSGEETTWTPTSIGSNTKANVSGMGEWYYTWTTATAGGSSSNMSICPKGWRVPANQTSNPSFYYLLSTSYGITSSDINKVLATPISLTINGEYNGSLQNATLYGRYWTSTPGGNGAYYFGMSSTSVMIGTELYTYTSNGYNVRCVAIP